MEIKVTGRKIRITDSLHDRVISKIGDALKVFDIQPMTADVVLRVANYKGTKERTICEVTVRVRGTVVRVTATKDDAEAVRKLIDKIEALKAAVGVKKTIADYGVKEEDFLATLDEMCENAFDDQCTGANPRYPLISEIREMYLRAYYGDKYKAQ